jgi:hypothetical protein
MPLHARRSVLCDCAVWSIRALVRSRTGSEHHALDGAAHRCTRRAEYASDDEDRVRILPWRARPLQAPECKRFVSGRAVATRARRSVIEWRSCAALGP